MTLGSARAQLMKVGLQFGKVSYKKVLNRKQRGRIVSQSPAAGQSLAKGGSVDITVGR